jgi:hypothetical protein
MCREQSRPQRTIATSRSDDNRDESRNERHRERPTINQGHEIRKTGNHALRYRCAKTSEGDRLSLTNSFRKGHIGRSTLTRGCLGVSDLRVAGDFGLRAEADCTQGNRIKTTTALFARGVDLVKGPTNDAPGERNANPEVMDAGPQPFATICHAL